MSPRRQWVKWTVYAVLFLDFVIYLYQDAESAHVTLGAHPALADYVRAYVTSIDLAAWFALILLYELETYVLVDRQWTGGTKWAVHGVRLLCCVAILNTSYSNFTALRDFQHPQSLPAAADACAYAEGDWSFLRNRDYIDLDRGNCAKIGRGSDFFAIGRDAVLTDREGLREGLILAWTDLTESVAWLFVILANELIVRFEGGAIPNGTVLTLLGRFKSALYVLILSIAFYWGWKEQYLYLSDELIWICGFLAIDSNIHEWRLVRRSKQI